MSAFLKLTKGCGHFTMKSRQKSRWEGGNDMTEAAEKLKSMLDASENIVFLGGAGVSTASGIPDFRGTYGLFQQERGISYEEMLSHDHFVQNPEDFYGFYTKGMLYPNAQPNGAHYALAELEKRGKVKAVITQNIDGLHTKAGSKTVIELHGSAHRNFCVRCGKSYGMESILQADGAVPYCECGGIIKPDVVLYGECLDDGAIQKAIQFISASDLLLVAGTSLVVYPAAGFVRFARGKMVLLNRDTTQYDAYADLVIHEDLAAILSEAVFDHA